MATSKARSIVDDLKKFKKLEISLLNESSSPCVVNEWLSSGCLALDWILGGGFPIGRLTEIYGDTSTGKSLIAAQAAALAQDAGHIVVMADTESAVSLPIMKAVGVNTDELIYSAPDTVEEVFDIFEKAIDSKKKNYPDAVMLLIWDSVAATSVESEMEADYGKAMMGNHARLISQSLRKITRRISKERICALFLNQTRQKIGIMFGDNEATFGGKAISFYASVRLRLKMKAKLKKGKKIVAIETRASCVKNKVAMPFRSTTLPIFFGHGIDDPLASLYWLEEQGFVDKSGSHKAISIDGKDYKFNKASWPSVFDKNYDDISELIVNFDDADEGAELEESDNDSDD